MIKAETRYYIVVKENIDNTIEFENELLSKTYDEAEKEASNVLVAYYLSLMHCSNCLDYRDLTATVEKKIVLKEVEYV